MTTTYKIATVSQFVNVLQAHVDGVHGATTVARIVNGTGGWHATRAAENDRGVLENVSDEKVKVGKFINRTNGPALIAEALGL